MNTMRAMRRPLMTAALACALLCPSSAALALNPALDASQYVHTAWRGRDGLWSGDVTAVAQTPDGYLWVGTSAGLFRFDGVRAVLWSSPSLPSPTIRSLASGHDGTVWIGTDKGLASWKDGQFVSHHEFGGGPIHRMLIARDGSLWLIAGNLATTRYMLCHLREGRVECYGADGGPGADALGLYEDPNGILWVGTFSGVWQWQPGRRFYPLASQVNGIQALANAEAGDLLLPMPGGIRRLENGRAEPFSPFPESMQDVTAYSLLRDRDGGLWAGTSTHGLVHVHQGRMDVFTKEAGLSSDNIFQIFEDREGDVWVATAGGLDRFREAPATLAAPAFSSSPARSLLASRDGGVWFGGQDYLSHVTADNQLTIYRAHRSPPVRIDASQPVREVVGPWAARMQSLFEDRRGHVWVAAYDRVGYLDRDRFITVEGLPGGIIRGIVEDQHSVWVANQNAGLYEMSASDQVIQHLPWTALGLPTTAIASAIAADASASGVWLGFTGGRVVEFADGRVRVSLGPSDGLGNGFVHFLHVDRARRVWAATDNGLSRLTNGGVATLSRKNGLPCDPVQWLADDERFFWVGTACGVLQIANQEINRWVIAADANARETFVVHPKVFGTADGGRLNLNGAYYTSPVVISTDGRVWFLSSDGVSVLDPRHVPTNTLAPPVHIEELIADHKIYGDAEHGKQLRLPRLTRDLQINYTALSFVAPEKMQFRYKLEGFDADWQEAGNRRQAFYTNLPPRDYRFRVVASNNDGVWNETGAAVSFIVAPAYYQTTWFLVLSAALVVAAAWGGHRLRLRIVERHQREITALNERLMNVQEQERTRIAGELHDGVMQEMVAVTMMLGSAKRWIDAESRAKPTIEKAQQKLVQVGSDIRQMSHDLHPPMLQQAGLPRAMESYCDQFSASSGIAVTCEADERVRELSRGTALALYRVVQEALGNTLKHAKAKHVRVRLTRSADDVVLTVEDDGVGFDPNRLGPTGGLGLITMRERASQLNGTFEFSSAPGRGTTIRVVIPFR